MQGILAKESSFTKLAMLAVGVKKFLFYENLTFPAYLSVLYFGEINSKDMYINYPIPNEI